MKFARVELMPWQIVSIITHSLLILVSCVAMAMAISTGQHYSAAVLVCPIATNGLSISSILSNRCYFGGFGYFIKGIETNSKMTLFREYDSSYEEQEKVYKLLKALVNKFRRVDYAISRGYVIGKSDGCYIVAVKPISPSQSSLHYKLKCDDCLDNGQVLYVVRKKNSLRLDEIVFLSDRVFDEKYDALQFIKERDTVTKFS